MMLLTSGAARLRRTTGRAAGADERSAQTLVYTVRLDATPWIERHPMDGTFSMRGRARRA
jgi:hypothetical protein